MNKPKGRGVTLTNPRRLRGRRVKIADQCGVWKIRDVFPRLSSFLVVQGERTRVANRKDVVFVRGKEIIR